MKSLLVAAILLIGSYSFANFTGQWQGDATVTTKEGKKIYCDEIIINVAQKTDKLEFGKFRYACGEFAFNFTPPEMTLVKTASNSHDVIWKDQNAGKITDKTANLYFVVSETGRARYTVNKISPNEMSYIDEQIGVDPNTGEEKITTVDAKLTRVQ